MTQWILKGRWGLLFLALVVQMVFNPCMEFELGHGAAWTFVFLNCLVVAAIIFNLARHWWGLVFALVLGIPIIVLSWIPETYETWILSLSCALYGFATLMLLNFLLRSMEPAYNELFAAGSLYILLGFTWATVYNVLEVVTPGSFSTGEPLSFGDFTYYSFVTLTTLGYGDIVPLTCKARSLASLEAMSGILTLSVVVARIIGLHAARGRDPLT